MYASQLHVHGSYAVDDQREVSRLAAERYAQLAVVAESRRERRQRVEREARAARHQSAVVPAA